MRWRSTTSSRWAAWLAAVRAVSDLPTAGHVLHDWSSCAAVQLLLSGTVLSLYSSESAVCSKWKLCLPINRQQQALVGTQRLLTGSVHQFRPLHLAGWDSWAHERQGAQHLQQQRHPRSTAHKQQQDSFSAFKGPGHWAAAAGCCADLQRSLLRRSQSHHATAQPSMYPCCTKPQKPPMRTPPAQP